MHFQIPRPCEPWLKNQSIKYEALDSENTFELKEIQLSVITGSMTT